MKSDAFELLHPKIQQLVLDQGWTDLHPVQEQAIHRFSASGSDLIITAPTSGGKTEAIILPLLSEYCASPKPATKSVWLLGMSPLKALINDQFQRLCRLCEPLGLPVHRWHGDVDQEVKRRLRDRPSGILLMTPESLESLFINYPHRVKAMFGGLQYIVIDELHALTETERGVHVRSLLSRIAAGIGRKPRSFALSATVGDPFAARSFVNPDDPDSVQLVADRSTARPIFVQVVSVGTAEAYAPEDESDQESWRDEDEPAGNRGPLSRICDDLRNVFRDGSFLVFGNSRRVVEELGDLFRADCQVSSDEPVVALHHGSLAAPLRKKTEALLKSGQPTRALCTSSLELGIDIGAIEAVAQIDAPWSVSSLVQRLGRSGRRPGSNRNLRLYVRIPPLGRDASLVDLLHPQLLQAVAMVKLLLAGWLEPTSPDRMHLSTLTHQILSILKETGAQTPPALYQSLCRRGPFRRVEPSDFKRLLVGLGEHDVLKQDREGLIYLGNPGERITSAPTFYAAFATPVELTVRCGARDLGRLPAMASLQAKNCLLLDGRRWLVHHVDWKRRTVWVSATEIKQPTVFIGSGGEIHDRIAQEMRSVLVGEDRPDWLDAASLEYLELARDAARRAGLDKSSMLDLDGRVRWFPWVGTRTMRTLHCWSQHVGLRCDKDDLSLAFDDISLEHLEAHLADFAEHGVDPLKLAELMPNKQRERFDIYVEDGLLDKANALDRLDVRSARQAAVGVLRWIEGA